MIVNECIMYNETANGDGLVSVLDYDHRTAKRSDPPLVCIEIQSPSQSTEEMVDKTAVYFRFGVKIVLDCGSRRERRFCV